MNFHWFLQSEAKQDQVIIYGASVSSAVTEKVFSQGSCWANWLPLSGYNKPYLDKSEKLSVPPGAELFLGLQPEPWLRGRWFGGMRVTEYSSRLWGTGLSLQHLLLSGTHLSTVVAWKTLRGTPGAVKSYTAQSWPPACIQIAAGHTAPSSTHKGAISGNPIPLHSSLLHKPRHHKKFNASWSCLPWVLGLGVSFSTLKCTVLCQSLDLTCEDTSATSPAPHTLPWGCPHGPNSLIPEFLGMSV